MQSETLVSWLMSLGKAGVRSLPSMAKGLAIKIGIVVLVQLVFWWDKVSRVIPDSIKGPVIFLTATYNNVIPKTIYWVIVFTFGKKLFDRIRTTGFQKAMRPIVWMIPEFKKTFNAMAERAYPLILAGIGAGLIVANNFSSYSRFSGARNKMDKYFISLVISFTISYLLGEGRKHWIFKFCRLAASDFSRISRLRIRYSDDQTYILLTGFVIGLLADAPLILLKIGYGGYIAGGIFLALSIAARISRKKTVAAKA